MAETHDEEVIPELTIAPDFLSATLTLRARLDDPPATAEACLAALRESGIELTGDTESLIADLVQSHTDSPLEQSSVLIAQGSPQISGENGRIEFCEGFDPDAPAEHEDESSAADSEDANAINYYNCRAFCLVEQGDRIANVIPPTPGTPGRSVTGEPIPAEDGVAVPLTLDETVERAADGALRAAKAGLLVRAGDALRVETKLDVCSDVDFSTGNIRFHGDIVIEKGVRDCFLVEATGSVTVRGAVEAATIRSGMHTTLAAGMAARDKGRLEIGRDLEAHYLNSVDGVIGRHLTVQKEIITCRLTVRGSITSEQAVLAGGVVRVCGSVLLAEIGSDSGVTTELVFGAHPEIETMQAAALKVEEQIDANCRAHDSEFDTLTRNMQKLNKDQQKRYRELRKMTRDYEELHARIRAGLEEMFVVANRCVLVDITVKSAIHPGVRLMLGNTVVDFDEPLAGPVRIFRQGDGRLVVEDTKRGSTEELATVARVSHLAPPTPTEGDPDSPAQQPLEAA